MTRIGDRRASDGIVKTVMPVWAIRTIRMNKVYWLVQSGIVVRAIIQAHAVLLRLGQP